MSIQLANLDVSKPNFAIVVLQCDVTFGKCSELIEVLELTGRDQFLQTRALTLKLDHFGAVDPMLDVLALNDDAGRVEVC